MDGEEGIGGGREVERQRYKKGRRALEKVTEMDEDREGEIKPDAETKKCASGAERKGGQK